MKKLMIALMMSSSLLAFGAFADTLYVNGKAVSPSVIDAAMNQFKKSSPMAAMQMKNPQFKKQILQSIGMQQAILLEGNSLHLDTTSEYKNELEQVKPMLYAQILQQKAVGSSVTDAEVKAKYDQLKAQAVNQKQYDVSHILVKDLKTADMIEADLKKGEKFSVLAQKYSIDPGSKAKGGELGLSDGSNYVPEFTQAILKLKKGQYTTTPIKTQFGYHIIKLNDVKIGSSALPQFAKIKDQLKQQLQMEKTRSFFDGLKAKYKVEVK